MTVKESDLPGVGKKFTYESGGREIIVLVHNTGRREVYTRDDPDEDSERILELSDKEARIVGSLLEGAHFQPVADDEISATLTDSDNLIEWVEVEEGSALDGMTLSEADVRDRHGVSVIAVQDDETVPNPTPDTRMGAGQTLVLLGSRDGYEAVKGMAKKEET